MWKYTIVRWPRSRIRRMDVEVYNCAMAHESHTTKKKAECGVDVLVASKNVFVEYTIPAMVSNCE